LYALSALSPISLDEKTMAATKQSRLSSALAQEKRQSPQTFTQQWALGAVSMVG